jgi:YkoY family integral membrane protein
MLTSILAVLMVIGTLAVMEMLLSMDNALVLSKMAESVKDEQKRGKALYYGYIGAVGFRAICIGLGTLLIKFWFIKLFGAIYLAKLAIEGLFGEDTEDNDDDGVADKWQNTKFHKVLGKIGIKPSQFWMVVISIELMDLSFSIDSILASLAVSKNYWILLLGGIIGIAMMRGVAQFFMKLTKKVPELNYTAYILIGIIAIKMFISTLGDLGGLLVSLGKYFAHVGNIEVSALIFLGVLVVTFGVTFLVHYKNTRKSKKVAVEVKEA